MLKTRPVLFHLAQLVLLILLVFLAVVSFRSVDQKIEEAAETLRAELIGTLESQYNIRLEYDSMSPSFLSSIQIRNIRVYTQNETEPVLEIERLKLRHDLSGLLLRGDTVVRSISVSGLSLDVDDQRDGPFLQTLSSSGGGGAVPGLDTIFTQYIRIRNWEASFNSSQFTASGKGDLISLRQQGEYARLTFDGKLNYQSSAAGAQLEYFTLDTALKGTVQNDLSAFSLDSDFRTIDTNLAVIASQRLNINYGNDQLRITKIKDTKPFDLNFTLDDERIKVSLIAEEFSPARLISFKSDLAVINPWLESVMSGSAEFAVERNTGFISYDYEGNLTVDNDQLPFPVKISLDIKGDDLHINSEKLLISTPAGNANLVGQWVFQNGFPEGQIRLSNVKAGPYQTISGTLLLENIDEYLSLRSRNLQLADGSSPGTLKALVYSNEQNYVFSVLSDLNPYNNNRDRVMLDGSFSMDKGFNIRSSFRLSDFQVAGLSPYLSPGLSNTLNTSLNDLLVQSEGSVSFSPGNLIVQLNRFQSFTPDGSRSLSLSGFYGDRELDVHSLEFIWDNNYLLGSGTADFNNQAVSIASNWNLNDNKYEINALQREGQLSVAGSHGLKIQLAGQGDSRLLGTMILEEAPVRWDGQDYLASLNLRGRYGQDNWEVFLSDSSFRWMNSTLLQEPELSVTAFMAPGVVNIFSMDYADSFSRLNGEGSFFYDMERRVYNGSLALTEPGTGPDLERYDIFAAYSEGSLSLTTQLENARTERFSVLNMNGRVDSAITIQGTLDDPVLEASVNAPGLEMDKNPFALKGDIRLSSRKLELSNLNLQRNNLYLRRGLGVFDLKDGSLVFTASLANNGDEGEESDKLFSLESGFSIKADTGMTFNFRNFEVPELEDFSGRLRIHPVKWNGLTTFSSKTVDFTRKGSIFESVLLEDPEQFVRYDSTSGRIRGNLKQDFPVAMKMDGFINTEGIDLSLDDMVLSLNMINYVMPKDKALDNRYVVFKKGSLMEGALQIGGTLDDPEFYGKLSSRDLFVLTPYTESSIDETFIEATINNDFVETNEFFIPIGRGGIRAQGTMTMNGWGIKEYDLPISVEGTPGTPIAYNAYGLQGTGAVTGQFRFYGDNKQGNFDGRVVLDELVGSFGEKTVIAGRKRIRRNRYAFRLNLDIETGKNVIFVLPNPQVELVRATAEQGEVLNVTVDSMNKTLSMTGGISIRDGEIYYFDRTFEILEGSLTFNEDEETFNPFLNIEAEIDTSDSNGDEVTITLVYRNPVRDEFTPILRSNPSMPEDEIVALFGQSLIPLDSSGEVDISNVLLATGGMVSQYGFVRPLEKSIKESLNLDTVTIRTEILENAIIDQLNRESSTTDASTTYSMTKYLDDTSIYLGKFAGDSLYFSAGMVVDYDQLYGLGSYFNGIQVVPDLTIEMRTPFFLVYWNYNKRNAFDFHNTDLMKNNAIGFEWRYSY
ncbi:MAG: translocation/assembly module TamB domain-containing protein [Spirochaetales bacterium]|nr:translocation/assembly module TamB domain-containing protein [Spirochaetales bacterium]